MGQFEIVVHYKKSRKNKIIPVDFVS